MPPDIPPAVRRPLLESLRATCAALERRLQRSLADTHPELHRSQAGVLLALPAEGLGLTSLAKQLGASKQAVARPVAMLEKKGYLQMTRHPKDGRAVVIRPTAKGHEYARAMLGAAGALETQLALDIGAGRVAELRELLALVEQSLAKRA